MSKVVPTFCRYSHDTKIAKFMIHQRVVVALFKDLRKIWTHLKEEKKRET